MNSLYFALFLRVRIPQSSFSSVLLRRWAELMLSWTSLRPQRLSWDLFSTTEIWWEIKLDWGIRTLKKSAKFKLIKDFQFYSRFSSLLISRSYLIPTVSPQSQLYVQTFYIVNSSLNWIQVIESQRTIQKMTVSFNAYSIIFVCMISVIQTDS